MIPNDNEKTKLGDLQKNINSINQSGNFLENQTEKQINEVISQIKYHFNLPNITGEMHNYIEKLISLDLESILIELKNFINKIKNDTTQWTISVDKNKFISDVQTVVYEVKNLLQNTSNIDRVMQLIIAVIVIVNLKNICKTFIKVKHILGSFFVCELFCILFVLAYCVLPNIKNNYAKQERIKNIKTSIEKVSKVRNNFKFENVRND